MDPNNENILYLTLEGFESDRVWKGVKEGSNWKWTSLDNGLPSTFVRAIAVDPVNSSRLFLATDYGVYESTDSGANWTEFSSGLLPAIEGVQLIVYEKYRKLRLVSHGNGVWERSI